MIRMNQRMEVRGYESNTRGRKIHALANLKTMISLKTVWKREVEKMKRVDLPLDYQLHQHQRLEGE